MTTLYAPNVLLEGPPGTGKTHAIGTLVDTGVEVFYLPLESGLESVISYYAKVGKPVPKNFHWHPLTGVKKTFADLKTNAENVLKFDQKTLANMPDHKRSVHNAWIQIHEAMCNFTDQHGVAFGAVDEWGADRWLVIDGLTGLCEASMSAVIGNKPMRSMADWGLAQDNVERFLRMATDQCPCGFVLISHVSRETDEVLGGVKLLPAALGKALAPKLPAMFSDVILAKREGSTWTWDTADSQADVKARNLPWKAGQPPSFAPLIDSWKTNAAAIAAATGKPA